MEYLISSLLLQVVQSLGPNNLGLALDRNIWNKIKANTDMFCEMDEYNWDNTLYNVLRSIGIEVI